MGRGRFHAYDYATAALAPFIAGQAVKGPAAKIFAELGLATNAAGIVAAYDGLLDSLVIDRGDRGDMLGDRPTVLATNMLMKNDADQTRLAAETLAFARGITVSDSQVTTYAILAAQLPETGKSRLAPILSPVQRVALNHRMFDHVLSVVGSVPSLRCIVVSRSPDLLDKAHAAGAVALAEVGVLGLNAAFTQGAEVAAALGATAVLSLSSDLPELAVEDIEMMLAAAQTKPVVIAPDRHGTGTNALLVRPPLLFTYAYGVDSLARHKAAAEFAGQPIAIVARAGLARDVDEPTDLIEAKFE